jgi:predicted nucleic acid-binding Zn ribbon protein
MADPSWCPHQEQTPHRVPGVYNLRCAGDGDAQPEADLRDERGAACAPAGAVEPPHEADGGLCTRLWKCECGEEWYARISSRTRSDRPRGCPQCNYTPAARGIVATKTHNLKLTCEESEGRLARLLEEWDHPTMRMEEFCPGSAEIVRWKCAECGGQWDAKIGHRTRSDRPTRCPKCSNNWTKNKKLVEL